MTEARPIQWTLDPGNPVIAPGAINGPLDARHAGAGHAGPFSSTDPTGSRTWFG